MKVFQFKDTNKTYLFLLFILALILISLISDTFILKENLYYDYFKDQLTYDQVSEILRLKDKWFFINSIFIPVFYLLKFLILSMWLMTGLILLGYKVSLRKVFHACILSEFVLLIPSIIGLIWFGFIDNAYSLQDVQQYHPLSLLSLFDNAHVDSWLIYPLQLVSIFQLAYIFALAFGIRYAIDKDYKISLSITFPVYLVGIAIWVIFVAFLTLSYTL
jgi:hypothetical protein